MDQAKADELVQEVGGLLLDDPAFADHVWDGLAAVMSFGKARTSVYAYRFHGEAEPVFLEVEHELYDLLVKLREEMTKGRRPWQSCLIQITQPDLGIEIDFDYDDPDRWKITPANMNGMIEEIRPG